MEEYDVAVVGAGPAGSSAARVAVEAGARVLLVDRADFPRYKTCGGGLIGPTLAHLPGTPPTRAEVRRVSFTLAGERHRERRSATPVVRTAARTELDAWLLDEAARAGAEVRTGCSVSATEHGPEAVLVRTAAGVVSARTVIAADGTGSRLAREVGVRLSRVDLGLEVELALDGHPGLATEWADRVHLDWGPLPGSYGWVFPKGDSLTVGVIAAKGRPGETRAHLEALVIQQRLTGLRVLHDSGHLTRCRAAGSPLGRGRVLLAGDAAGLLEPWTREGISFAVRSGEAAGRVAADTLALPDARLQSAYVAELGRELLPEMAAGERCLRAFERRPAAFHRLLAGTGTGWRQFGRLVAGETTLARADGRLPVRLGLAALSGSW